MKPHSESSRRQQDTWFTQRTEERFASLVKTLAELDLVVRQVLEQVLEADELPEMMIKAPFQGKLSAHRLAKSVFKAKLPWEFTPEWLLVLTARRLLLVRIPGPGKSPEVNPVPFEQILWLQNGTILLFSWFEVGWVEQGAVHQETIYYNAVSERYFSRLTAQIRQAICCPAERPPDEGQPDLSALQGLPHKFKNLLPLRALLPGETLQRVVYRPALWRTRLVVFQVMTAPRLAAALTPGCLILAEEDLTGREASYGFIVTYLLRRSILRMETQPEEGGPALLISLGAGGARKELHLAFPAQMEADLRDLTALF